MNPLAWLVGLLLVVKRVRVALSFRYWLNREIERADAEGDYQRAALLRRRFYDAWD